MTFSTNLGAERSLFSSDVRPRAEPGVNIPPPDDHNAAEQSKRHDQEAKELLYRYLSEIHSYRELGNAALRELENRLKALSESDHGFGAPEEAQSSAKPTPARRTIRHSALGRPQDGTLSDRLRELSVYLHADLNRLQDTNSPSGLEEEHAGTGASASQEPKPRREKAAAAPAQPRINASHKAPSAPVLDRTWFEERFAEMRSSINQVAEQIPTRRMEALEDQFRLLMEKLDARDTSRSMAAVEAGLKKLAAYLDDNREWSSHQDARLSGVEDRLDQLSGLVAQSHAALCETAKGLEIVARGTGAGLANDTADLVARKLEPRFATLDQSDNITRLSGEVSKISAQSTHFTRSTEERLKHLQNCLEESLDRLDDYDSREDAPRSEKSWLNRVEDDSFDDERDDKMVAAARRAARFAESPGTTPPQNGEPVRYHIPYGEFLPTEERQSSRKGLIIAAVILLLASAAMLYLNLRGNVANKSPSSAWLSYATPERDLNEGRTGPLTTTSVKTEIIKPASPRGKQDGRLAWNSGHRAPAPSTKNGITPGAHAAAAAPVEPATRNGRPEPLPVVAAEKTANIRSAAIAGDAEAQFSIGETYLQGGDVRQKLPFTERLSKAARWFRRAAEKGHVPSQYRLATLYELGKGAPRDIEEAKSWYQRAAEAGHVKAMHNLAVLSVIGDQRSANYLTAAKWFAKAAEHGVTDSQYNLALLYERGLGLPKDPILAYHWYALAAKQGDEVAAQHRDRLAARLPRDELSRLNREMTAWVAHEADADANGKAPEPPSEQPGPRQAALKPEASAPQLITASWSPVVQLAPEDRLVAEAQELLLKLGFAPGPIDGILGPRTIAAIRAFETKTGLPDTGKPTQALVARMAFSL